MTYAKKKSPEGRFLFIRGDLEHPTLVFYLNLTESFEHGLPEQERCFLIAYDGGANTCEFKTAEVDMVEHDGSTDRHASVRCAIGLRADDIALAEVAVLKHEVRFRL